MVIIIITDNGNDGVWDGTVIIVSRRTLVGSEIGAFVTISVKTQFRSAF